MENKMTLKKLYIFSSRTLSKKNEYCLYNALPKLVNSDDTGVNVLL